MRRLDIDIMLRLGAVTPVDGDIQIASARLIDTAVLEGVIIIIDPHLENQGLGIIADLEDTQLGCRRVFLFADKNIDTTLTLLAVRCRKIHLDGVIFLVFHEVEPCIVAALGEGDAEFRIGHISYFLRTAGRGCIGHIRRQIQIGLAVLTDADDIRSGIFPDTCLQLQIDSALVRSRIRVHGQFQTIVCLLDQQPLACTVEIQVILIGFHYHFGRKFAVSRETNRIGAHRYFRLSGIILGDIDDIIDTVVVVVRSRHGYRRFAGLCRFILSCGQCDIMFVGSHVQP